MNSTRKKKRNNIIPPCIHHVRKSQKNLHSLNKKNSRNTLPALTANVMVGINMLINNQMLNLSKNTEKKDKTMKR
jgi:hypothetical protein